MEVLMEDMDENDNNEEENGIIKLLMVEYDGVQSKLVRYEMNANFLKAAFVIDFENLNMEWMLG